MENLHAIATALLALAVSGAEGARRRVGGAALAVAGVAILSYRQFDGAGSAIEVTGGIALAIAAAVTYALYLYYWSFLRPKEFAHNAYQTLAMVMFVGATLLVARAMWGIFTGRAAIMTISYYSAIVQVLVGVVSIGLTYLLLSASLSRSQTAGWGGSAIASFGISYSVLTTYLVEVALFGSEVSLLSLLAIALFIGGFMLVWTSRDFGGQES
ncbi:MAG TPA: hypothetical protein VGW40_10525 [Allosphingosinicella sp.]|nr:hypothetical protein [Allosphingosinicella sp.]